MNQKIILSDKHVICTSSDTAFFDQWTIKCGDFKRSVEKWIASKGTPQQQPWSIDWVDGEVLICGQGWVEGVIRIRVEVDFMPYEEEQEEELEEELDVEIPVLPPSPLDDFREVR